MGFFPSCRCASTIVWMHHMQLKRLEKKVDVNYSRILQAILNKPCEKHPMKQQLYDHLPPISKKHPVRRTRYTGHCCRSKNELIEVMFFYGPLHTDVPALADQQALIYISSM